GFLSPTSHFCTVDTLVLSTEAKTAWLRWACSRGDLICCGCMSGTPRWRRASNSPMRRLLMSPAPCSPCAVSCISSRMRLLRLVVAIAHLHNLAHRQGGLAHPAGE